MKRVVASAVLASLASGALIFSALPAEAAPGIPWPCNQCSGIPQLTGGNGGDGGLVGGPGLCGGTGGHGSLENGLTVWCP